MTVILSLDTTASNCAVALINGTEVLVSKSEPMTKGQAERLFPMIDEVLQEANLAYKSLDAIAVAVGPGNFTGVRICVSAARGLSMSLNVPAIGISCLEALAYGHTGRILAILDARANQIYAQMFGSAILINDPILIARSELAEKFPRIDRCVGFCANELAYELGVTEFKTKLPDPETYALIALSQDWTITSRPAPLYLRSPDAALPSEPPPHIIP